MDVITFAELRLYEPFLFAKTGHNPPFDSGDFIYMKVDRDMACFYHGAGAYKVEQTIPMPRIIMWPQRKVVRLEDARIEIPKWEEE